MRQLANLIGVTLRHVDNSLIVLRTKWVLIPSMSTHGMEYH